MASQNRQSVMEIPTLHISQISASKESTNGHIRPRGVCTVPTAIRRVPFVMAALAVWFPTEVATSASLLPY